MSLIYIAAPLGAPTEAHRRWNRERARVLCALAAVMGLTPVCVHPYAELAFGSDTDPAAREEGLAQSLETVKDVQRAEGMFWCLLLEDPRRPRSAGCERESAVWVRGRIDGDPQPIERRWDGWKTVALKHAPHLLPEFDRLSVPPPGPELTGGWEGTVDGDHVMCCARTGEPVAMVIWPYLWIGNTKIPEFDPVFSDYTDVLDAASALVRAAGYVVPDPTVK